MLSSIAIASAPPIFGGMLASVESLLIFLIIAGISSFVQWVKKQKEQGDDWTKEQTPPTYPHHSPAPSQPHPTRNWEEELRRMLEGNQPTPPPTRPTAPPIITPSPARAPHRPAPTPPPSKALPKAFPQPKIYKAHCDHCDGHLEFPSELLGESFVCPHCFGHTVLQPYSETRVERMRHQPELATLKEAASAMQRAQQIDERMAGHLAAVSHTPAGLTEAQKKQKRSPEIEQTVALLKNPRTARQAIVASLILGTPKALEN